MRKRLLLVGIVVAIASSGTATSQDLFEEAGHSIGHSRWVTIRLLPAIEIALEADDVVLVRSIDHPAKSFAMKIDGKALAGDCVVTETEDTSYTYETETKEKKHNYTSGSTSTTTTYWARCEFAEGTARAAQQASDIIVQVAMTNGNTNPHQLRPKQLRKFQEMKD